MACKVIQHPDVRRELEHTLDYLEFVLFEPTSAKELARSYLVFIKNVARFPEMYPLARDEILSKRGIRAASLQNYVVLYVYDDTYVQVLHLFHQSQDYARLV